MSKYNVEVTKVFSNAVCAFLFNKINCLNSYNSSIKIYTRIILSFLLLLQSYLI